MVGFGAYLALKISLYKILSTSLNLNSPKFHFSPNLLEASHMDTAPPSEEMKDNRYRMFV
jgi:hypothetical protein